MSLTKENSRLSSGVSTRVVDRKSQNKRALATHTPFLRNQKNGLRSPVFHQAVPFLRYSPCWFSRDTDHLPEQRHPQIKHLCLLPTRNGRLLILTNNSGRPFLLTCMTRSQEHVWVRPDWALQVWEANTKICHPLVSVCMLFTFSASSWSTVCVYHHGVTPRFRGTTELSQHRPPI